MNKSTFLILLTTSVMISCSSGPQQPTPVSDSLKTKDSLHAMPPDSAAKPDTAAGKDKPANQPPGNDAAPGSQKSGENGSISPGYYDPSKPNRRDPVSDRSTSPATKDQVNGKDTGR